MSGSSVLCLGSSLGMILVAFGVYWKTRCYSHPALIYSVFWAFMTMLPVLWVPELTPSAYASTYILVTTLAFATPALVMSWSEARTICVKRIRAPSVYSTKLLVAGVGSLVLATLAMMVLHLDRQGFSLSSVFGDPLAVGCRYLEMRYRGTVSPNQFQSIATIANYGAAIAAGLYCGSTRRRFAVLPVILLALIPPILNIIIYGDKGTIFLAGAFMFGAYLAASVSSGRTVLIDLRVIGTVVVVACVVVPIVGLSLMNRSGACDGNRTHAVVNNLSSALSGESTTKRVGNYVVKIGPAVPFERQEKPGDLGKNVELLYNMRSYALGHYFAFSYWFDDTYVKRTSAAFTNPPSLKWGFWTFLAVGKLIDKPYAATLPDGYYGEYVRVDNLLQTNIYTWYRGLIYDFGLIGSVAFVALLGWVSSLSYRSMMANPSAPISAAFYIFLIGFIYQCYIISSLTWNSPFGVPVIAAAIMLACSRTTRNLIGSPGKRCARQI